MARIRSIKPDFFTSETIAALPLSARLTFIGLWTYVDDNGVGLDNALLVTAAVWPLESDTPDTLERTRDDLARIARKGLISRYQDSRKHYLHVTSWVEHQKVDHPGKPRYPLPGDEAVTTVPTCDNADESRTSPESSREPRESVAPEQGAGSREQGYREQGIPATPAQSARAEQAATATAGTLIAEWIRACRKRPPDRVIGQISAEVRKLLDEGQDAEDIRVGLEQWRIAAKHPSTLASFVNGITNGGGSTTDRRQSEAEAVKARLRAKGLSQVNTDQVADLLALAAGYDQRTIGEGDVLAWHAVIGRLDYEDAQVAVIEHYRHETGRVMPADVLGRCRPPASRLPSSVPMTSPLDVSSIAAGVAGRGAKRFLEEAAKARQVTRARRERVLRHPDLARRLTEPPLGYKSPEQWNGCVPPAELQDQMPEALHSSALDGGFPNQHGKRTEATRANTSPRRAALVDICAEALRREHQGGTS